MRRKIESFRFDKRRAQYTQEEQTAYDDARILLALWKSLAKFSEHVIAVSAKHVRSEVNSFRQSLDHALDICAHLLIGGKSASLVKHGLFAKHVAQHVSEVSTALFLAKVLHQRCKLRC